MRRAPTPHQLLKQEQKINGNLLVVQLSTQAKNEKSEADSNISFMAQQKICIAGLVKQSTVGPQELEQGTSWACSADPKRQESHYIRRGRPATEIHLFNQIIDPADVEPATDILFQRSIDPPGPLQYKPIVTLLGEASVTTFLELTYPDYNPTIDYDFLPHTGQFAAITIAALKQQRIVPDRYLPNVLMRELRADH